MISYFLWLGSCPKTTFFITKARKKERNTDLLSVFQSFCVFVMIQKYRASLTADATDTADKLFYPCYLRNLRLKYMISYFLWLIITIFLVRSNLPALNLAK